MHASSARYVRSCRALALLQIQKFGFRGSEKRELPGEDSRAVMQHKPRRRSALGGAGSQQRRSRAGHTARGIAHFSACSGHSRVRPWHEKHLQKLVGPHGVVDRAVSRWNGGVDGRSALRSRVSIRWQVFARADEFNASRAEEFGRLSASPLRPQRYFDLGVDY